MGANDVTKKKNILLCVTGGIAVFKAAALTSKLVQNNFNVKVVQTESAAKFVTPVTFQALSRNFVYIDTFEEPDPMKIAHIDIADWADLVLVAPATANIIGKLANGIADDMVSTTLLATTAPIMIAPAMNVHMYAHPAVRKNMETLKSYGYEIVEPHSGYLACGYEGKGRMAEPEELLVRIMYHFSKKDYPEWHGKKILVSAGPTREKVDPVRFFTNRSSGKMGYAIAEEAAKRGATVTLISGPTTLAEPYGVKVIHVESAAEMYDAVLSHFNDAHIVIKAAAVADYRPKEVHEQKVKKGDGGMKIELERTKDILKTLGEKRTKQTLVGFAAESENVEQYAKEKLITKNVHMIAANSIVAPGSGFEGDTNELTLFKRNGEVIPLPKMTKNEAAKKILDEALKIHLENEQ